MSDSQELISGVDLGGTKIQTVVLDGDGQVTGQSRSATPTTGGPDDVIAAMASAVTEACNEAGVDPSGLAAIGVGSPGAVDGEQGTVSSALNLPDWAGSVAMGPKLTEALGPPAFIGNDVQVATEAEFTTGAGEPYGSILGVFWGTGVGGGLILDGEPWLGRGSAGEIGHMVIRRGGAKCPCGRRGCMEAYAGRKAMELKAREEVAAGKETDLFNIMEEHHKDRLTSGIWDRAVEHGDDLAIALMERAVKALAAGIASAVNLLDIEAVILGGGLGVRFGDRYLQRIQSRMHRHLFKDDDPPQMHVAALGDLGGAIGAAQLGARGISGQTSFRSR